MTDREPARITLTEDDRRALGLWAADCAERVLPLFEAKAPADLRPRDAIDGVRAYARGELRKGPLSARVWGALAAGREVVDPAATAAARAAGSAAGTAFMHPHATADQATHVLAPAMYGARARELAAGDDPGIGDEEIRWATDHAPAPVRDILRQMPVRAAGRTRLGALRYQLDVSLRG